jgi:DNA-binding MarR family transcriptional regulator
MPVRGAPEQREPAQDATPLQTRTELKLFTAIESGTDDTQISLSKRVGVAVGLVNALLKRAVRKGLVKVTSAPARRYKYYLTPKGFAEKSRLVAEYLNDSLSFFRESRAEYAALFADAVHGGVRRVVLAGAGELAEIAAIAAAECDVEIVAVVDAVTNQQRVAGIDVVRALGECPAFDCVVVTDGRAPQTTYDSLRRELASDRIGCPALLQVVIDREQPMARAAGGAA